MASDAFGVQGGDGAAPGDLDLATCVNGYGPPPQVMDVLATMEPETVRRHPYDAGRVIERVYGDYLGCSPTGLVSDRGASGLIWRLARVLQGASVAIPLPGYTEFFRAFPGARRLPGNGTSLSGAQLDAAMGQADATVIANPLNPTGSVLDRAVVEDVLGRHPDRLLVVDESYLDFLDQHRAGSLIGSLRRNVLVLRSPSKFFGMAGVRAGVAWSASRTLTDHVRRIQDTWPVSMVSARLVAAALESEDWAEQSRRRLADDARWLDAWLRRHGCEAAPGVLHFRLVVDSAPDLLSRLQRLDIRVRPMGEAHGVPSGSWRIAAPVEGARIRLDCAGLGAAGSANGSA